MKPNLILLTNQFPAIFTKAETWLLDELKVTHDYFENIYIIPNTYDERNHALYNNCKVININKSGKCKLNLKEIIICVKIVLSDYLAYPSKLVFFKNLRYNLSLIKQLFINAKRIAEYKEMFYSKPIIYAYWADNLATTAAILKQYFESEVKIVTRGHGFEIFEEQTSNMVIPFRRFQYFHINKIYADSKRGLEHLNANKDYKAYQYKNDVSYVGTVDMGIGAFSSNEFNIATCSVIRNVKQLHLLPEILKYIEFNLTWHVLGDGPDLEKLKSLNLTLTPNIRVVYHGRLSNSKILDFYKNNSINLLVSLSSSEGLPVSMMEAQSFGIPILSTDVGGCKEICNEQTGILVDKVIDPKLIAQEITTFRNSYKNTQKFRDSCRNYWITSFKAEDNYKKFAEEIINL